MSRTRLLATAVVFLALPALGLADDPEQEKKAKMEIEVYKEAEEFVRHFSTLRFTALTVFITISSALLTVHLKRDYLKPEYQVRVFVWAPWLLKQVHLGLPRWVVTISGWTTPILKVIGYALAIVFGIGQGRISWDLKDCDFRADKIVTDSGMPSLLGSTCWYIFWWWFILLLVESIHIGAILIWYFVPPGNGAQNGGGGDGTSGGGGETCGNSSTKASDPTESEPVKSSETSEKSTGP